MNHKRRIMQRSPQGGGIAAAPPRFDFQTEPFSETPSHSRGALRPKFCSSFRPRKEEGAGKTGCALHPRSRVQNCAKKTAHEHTGSAETLRPSLRNGLTAYAALSPATNSSCHRRCRIRVLSDPVGPTCLRQLDTSNGCQDHTVLPYASAPFVRAPVIAHGDQSALRSLARPTLSRPSHPTARS